MHHLGSSLHLLAAAFIVFAIWTPWHWQFAATALLLFLVGAITHGAAITAEAQAKQADDARADMWATQSKAEQDKTQYGNHPARRTYGKPSGS